MKTFQQLGTEIGALVERKNAAYGDSFSKCGDYLRLLYPSGIQPHQYADAMLAARDFDKSMRIANDTDAFGENPYVDKAGYAILGAHMHQQRKASEPWPGTASADVAKSSEAKQPDSAEPNASVSISPSASATTVHEPLPQPDGCCETLMSASAQSAMEAASPSAEGLRQGLESLFAHLVTLMRQSNSHQLCARCGQVYASRRSGASLMGSVWGEQFVVCFDCASDFPRWRDQLETVRRLEMPR